MPGPARAGALIYAKRLDALSRFYQALLGMAVRVQDAEHHVLENSDFQLIVHAMPAHIAETVEIAEPPLPRGEQAIKLFFTVSGDLGHAEALVQTLGGGLLGGVYEGPGFKVRNAFDLEGNIFHLRASMATPQPPAE